MVTKKIFSPEEIKILKANPYTARVSSHSISFTVQFKEDFWNLRLLGYTGASAFRALGYDPDILGFYRVHNLTKRIRYAAHKPGGIQASVTRKMRIRRTSSGAKGTQKFQQEDTARQLQQEIVYLQQQMAFLKKIMNPGKKDVPQK